VDPATVAGAIRLLNGSTLVASTVTLSLSGIVADILPSLPLAPLTTYELAVGTSLRNSAGEALESPTFVSFTTVESVHTTTFVVTHIGPVVADQPVNFAVTVKGGDGNILTDYSGTLHFASSDPLAQLPANYAFLAGDRGRHSFTVTFETAGDQTVTVTDAFTTPIVGGATVTVSPLPAPLSLEYFDFGYQTVNTVSAPKRITVTNNRTAPLSINFGMTDIDWPDFQQTNDCPSVLPVGATCTLSVTFKPNVIGARVGQVLLDNAWGVTMADVATPALSVAIASDATGTIGRFLYVANAESNNVAIYGINNDGTLTSRGTIGAGTAPSALTVDPSGSFVYVANFASNDVSAFAVAPDGTLISRGRIEAGSGPISVTVAPDPTGRFGRFLYVANSGSIRGPTPSTVSMYRIDASTGALTALVPAAVDAGVAPSSVSAHPSGRFAYVAHGDFYLGYFFSGTTVDAYAVDQQTGSLTALQSGMTLDWPTFEVTPPSLVFDPSGRFVILASGHAGATLSVDAASGGLAVTGRLSNNQVNAAVAAFDPSGRFAYAVTASRGDGYANTIWAYTVASDGVLVPTVSPSTPTGSSPTSMAIDPSGKFAYVANSGSKSISIYSIDSATGTLTLIGTIGL